MIGTNGQRLAELAELRQVKRGEPGCVMSISAGKRNLFRRVAGGVVKHLDDADKARRTIGDGGGASQDLDALDAAQLKNWERWIECAAIGNAVDDQEEGVKLLKPPEGGDCAGRPGIAPRGRVHAGDKRQGRAQVGDAPRPQALPA